MAKVYLRCFVPLEKLSQIPIIAAREGLGTFAVHPEMCDQDDPHYWVYFAFDDRDVGAVARRLETYDLRDSHIIEASKLQKYIHDCPGVLGRPKRASSTESDSL